MATVEVPEKLETKATGIAKKIQELEAKRVQVRLGGGEDKIAKQHEAGKLTARERIDRLVALNCASFQNHSLTHG